MTDPVTGIASQPVAAFLADLAARRPTPGGGASAGVHAAQAGALLAMVAGYTTGPRYAEHADAVAAIAAAADAERRRGLELADQDAVAFGAVGAAYRMPRATEEDRSSRGRAVQLALAGAARPPAEVVRSAARILEAAEQLLPIANPSVLTDVAAATEAARAAVTTARLNILINLHELEDPATRSEFTPMLEVVDDVVARAAEVDRIVRERVS